MNPLELTLEQPKKVDPLTSTWRDWLGIVASIGCAIHCAAMPFVFAYLPAMGLSFLADEAFHKWMALICFLIALAAFVPGIRKHGNWIPISIGTFGLVFITFAAFGLAGECCPSCNAETNVAGSVDGTETGCDQCEQCQACAEDESGGTIAGDANLVNQEKDLLSILAPWITPIGGAFLVCAHLLNRRYGCSCQCCAG